MSKIYIVGKSANSWFQLPVDIRRGYKLKLVEKYGSKCSSNGNGCGKSFPIDMLSVDHIIPVSMGGPVGDILNMQLLCFKCHKKKTWSEHPITNKKRKYWTELYMIKYRYR